MTRVIVDAMGGDNAPAEIVKGALLALEQRKDFSIVFTGDEALIGFELKQYSYDPSRVEVIPCKEVITGDDIPTTAVRTKRDSSLVVGLRMLKDEPDVAGFLSAGSTGAVLTGGVMHIGRIKGILRPALCPGIPNVRGGETLLCDCGANAECKPQYLVQFGLMAAAYARTKGVERPKVGLLNNGTEEHKGDPLHQEAFALLKEFDGFDFVGNVEGRDIMYGDVDIVVSDGFSGNVALKAIEGCGKTVSSVLKAEFTKNFGSKLSYLFAKKQINLLRNMLDYSKFGGSPFLGLKKLVVKCHGSSKASSITPAVFQILDAYQGDLIGKIAEMLAVGGETEEA